MIIKIQLLFTFPPAQRESNIRLTGKPAPRSGLARFVRKRAKRAAQTVTKGAVRLKRLLGISLYFV